MFLAAKILAFATQPLAWVMLLLALGLLLMRRNRAWGLRLNTLALALMLLSGWQPLPDALLRHLETQYPNPQPNAPLQGYAGVVVLGGALAPAHLWSREGQIALNDAGERMIVPVGLLRQHADWRIVFTGGLGELFGEPLTEAQRAKILFDNLGVPPDKVLYESASRTTYENAIFTARLSGVDPKQRWLLLTSASHMPRSMAAFQRAGWNVTPYAVDFRTSSRIGWGDYSLAGGAVKWHLALHEWVGLWAYRLSGRA